MINSRTIACGLTATAVLAGLAAVASPARATPPGATTTQLAGSMAPFARHGARAAAAGRERLTLQVWLTPRTSAAEGYATSVSTPGSALFGHYLTPAQYTARFGASASEARSVEAWLRSAGFSGVAADSERSYVRATAPVSVINQALGIQVKYYGPSRLAAARPPYPLRANDRPVSVPTSLADSVLGVTGLDNAVPVATVSTPLPPPPSAPSGPSFPCSHWYGQHYARKLPQFYGTTQFPTLVCGYSAAQLRRAYDYSPRYTGQGQTIAIVELGLAPYMFHTLQDYALVNHITSPVGTRYHEMSIGRGNECGPSFDDEEQLDVETTYAFAPGATQLVVGGDSCDNGDFGLQTLFNGVTAILDGNGDAPLASIVSNSWEGQAEGQQADVTSVEHALLVRAAAEGVGMYFATGDSSGVLTPSSDPFAIAVGGTTLGIGQRNPRLFETGWSTGMAIDTAGAWNFTGEAGGTGGGQSLLWAQPAYQRRVVPAALARAPGNRSGLVRTVPDISADGDPYTGAAVGALTLSPAGKPTGYTQTALGGTSLATPLIAALVADAQQGTPRPFGFINPLLYRLDGTRAFHSPEPVTGTTPIKYRAVACGVSDCGVVQLASFDNQDWSMSSYTGQVTRDGYGTMTGVGTPDGTYFIAALRKLAK